MKNKWGDSKKVTVTRLAEVEVTKSMAAAVEVEDEDGGGERESESESESESVPDMVAIGADTKHFRAAERGAFSLSNSLLFMHTSAPIYVIYSCLMYSTPKGKSSIAIV
jgi:hypothetical protein